MKFIIMNNTASLRDIVSYFHVNDIYCVTVYKAHRDRFYLDMKTIVQSIISDSLTVIHLKSRLNATSVWRDKHDTFHDKDIVIFYSS